MTHLLNIVKQQQQTLIDEEKLRQLCFYHNIWDHFGVSRKEFSALPEAKQLQLLRKFYFDLEPSLAISKDNPSLSHIDSSISSAIKNSSSLTMTKIIENGGDKLQLTVSSSQNNNGGKKSINLCPEYGYFGTESCDFAIEKANLPENTLFYINQGYQLQKDGKKAYYTDVFIIGQIMPLAQQPKDIDAYEPKDDEVKIQRPRYDPASGQCLSIEYCVGLITVRNDPQEQFFDYGYNKGNTKVLFSTQKLKIPNSFKTTIFGQHR